MSLKVNTRSVIIFMVTALLGFSDTIAAYEDCDTYKPVPCHGTCPPAAPPARIVNPVKCPGKCPPELLYPKEIYERPYSKPWESKPYCYSEPFYNTDCRYWVRNFKNDDFGV